MIDGFSISGALIVVSAVIGFTDSYRRWNRDRTKLTREVIDLTADARMIREHASQAIVKFKASGIIQTVNAAAEELFGYPANELIGESILKVLPDATTATRFTESIDITRNDGSKIRLPFTAVPLHSGPHPSVYLFFGVTPTKNIRPEGQASGEEDSSLPLKNSALSDAARIVGRIAARYETLLTMINCNSELALMELSEKSPSRQKLSEILSASEHASDLTRNLVAFSGRQFVAVEPIELNRLLMDMQMDLQRAFPHRIDFDLQPTDEVLLANAEFLRQAVLLLCRGAAGRMRGMDRLRIRTGQCDHTGPRKALSSDLKPGAYGFITICDSGKPLDESLIERIFEPLNLIHDELGVDLSPIYGVIRSLGGEISVSRGEQDAGTVFEILLPCMDPTDAKSTEPDSDCDLRESAQASQQPAV